MSEPQKRDLIITHHARERWLERVVDPKRYAHLQACPISFKGEVCEECIGLMREIHTILNNNCRRIDGRISVVFCEARDTGERITDQAFLEVIRNQYGKDISKFDFIPALSGKIVFMTKDDNGVPVLLTVLSRDMINGTSPVESIRMQKEGKKIIEDTETDLQKSFKRWKFEHRQNRRK